MQIRYAMTADVITVSPEESVHTAARLMADHGVSGLPVVDGAGRVAGIVSEGDLILRQATHRTRPWWRRFFEAADTLAREYQRAAGTTVGEVMTRTVVTVEPDADVGAAAAILVERGLRRLPVVDGGRLVGIVSRGDLVKVLATTPPAAATASDAELVDAMRARMVSEPWAPLGVVVEAHDGVLVLRGLVRSEAERSALETMARAIPGCRGVESTLAARPETPFVGA
jgi:CBS domain-containing protein